MSDELESVRVYPKTAPQNFEEFEITDPRDLLSGDSLGPVAAAVQLLIDEGVHVCIELRANKKR